MTEDTPPHVDDRELWACALAVLNQHEDNAAGFSMERVEAPQRAGDHAGVNVWLEIADRINRLVFGEGPVQ